MGPYRTKIDDDTQEQLSYEEKLILFRQSIPGPIRRILGLILIIPFGIVSFILAVFILCPLCWIFSGDQKLLWDKHINYNAFGAISRNLYLRGPLVRGTSALFVGDPDFYYLIRIGKIIDEEKAQSLPPPKPSKIRF